MPQRIQSPSSINYYNMCPRCYYYRYIGKLSLDPSIHLIRGKIVHKALEDFFDLKTDGIDKEHYEIELNIILQSIFKQRWEESKDQLDELKLDEKQEKYFFHVEKQKNGNLSMRMKCLHFCNNMDLKLTNLRI